jgi:hypothetical protein
MESFAFGLGVLLAILGPLLLLPAVWLLQRLLRPVIRRFVRDRWSPGKLRALAWLIATVVLASALAATYLPGRAEYERLCTAFATPQIAERVAVEGFYRERLFPYQAMPLLDQGFSYIETNDPQLPPGKHRLLRYQRNGDGGIRRDEIAAPTSRFGARHDLIEHSYGIIRTEKQVYDMADGRQLARAGNVTFSGGPLSLFFGAYAVASCPDVRTEQGAAAFGSFYALEQEVLGAGNRPPD